MTAADEWRRGRVLVGNFVGFLFFSTLAFSISMFMGCRSPNSGGAAFV